MNDTDTPVMRDEITPKQSEAWQLNEELIKAVHTQARLFVHVGRILQIIRDGKLYRYMGEGGYDTFEHYLNNAEIGLQYSTAYLYIRCYEYYIQKLALQPDEVTKIPVNRLQRLLPVLKKMTDDAAREKIRQIAPLTNYDFMKTVQEEKLEKYRPKMIRCKTCGGWHFEFRTDMLCECTDKQPAIRNLDTVERHA